MPPISWRSRATRLTTWSRSAGSVLTPPGENVGEWTRVSGTHDVLAAIPGFPDLHVTFLNVHHEEYFTERNVNITVDIVQAAGVE
jgi:hypothetical protein